MGDLNRQGDIDVRIVDANSQITASVDASGDLHSISKIRDSIGNTISPAKEDGNLAGCKTDLDKLTFDSSGNLKTTITSGGRVAIIQDVTVSILNSTTTNLNAGAVFTGIGESSLGASGINISFKANQMCTIHIYQSTDGTNWDIDDSYIVQASKGDGRSFLVVGRYAKVIVTNNGTSATTYLRLQTIYYPVVGGVTSRVAPQISESSITYYVSNDQVYTISSDLLMTSSGIDNPLFLLKNPVASGRIIYVYLIIMGVLQNNVTAEISVWSNPSITTDGILTTPSNNLIGGTASSSMTSHVLPTISSNGKRLASFVTGQNTQSVTYSGLFSMQVLPNSNLLLTGNPSTNGKPCVLSITWVEVPL